ncbi:MAG: hypothetical protein ACP5OC_03460 [Thermoplasmata archaeon]
MAVLDLSRNPDSRQIRNLFPSSKKGSEKINTINDNVFAPALDHEMDFDNIFSIVKKTVKQVTGKSRAGLGLALSNLPTGLGAFWQIGGNYIVMNEILLDAMRHITKSTREMNSFIYVILTHEYLHSVGYIDEEEARIMTHNVAEATFGKDHPVSVMSAGDLWRQYPILLSLEGGDGSKLKIVSKFDLDSTSYIG